MKITLPVVVKDELKDGARLFEYEEQEIAMNNTMLAQMRWESMFPEMAAKENIVDYAERVRGQKAPSLTVIISELKVIYCFLETDMTFIRFLKMFDFSQKEYTDKLLGSLKEAFDTVFATAAEKN